MIVLAAKQISANQFTVSYSSHNGSSSYTVQHTLRCRWWKWLLVNNCMATNQSKIIPDTSIKLYCSSLPGSCIDNNTAKNFNLSVLAYSGLAVTRSTSAILNKYVQTCTHSAESTSRTFLSLICIIHLLLHKACAAFEFCICQLLVPSQYHQSGNTYYIEDKYKPQWKWTTE